MTLSILGLGTSVPNHVMTQVEAAEMATQIACRDERQARTLKAIYRRSGVIERRTVLPHRIALTWLGGASDGDDAPPVMGPTTHERMQFYEAHAGALAEAATQRAVAEADVDPVSFTHLVTVTCTGFFAPGVDVHLIDRLGLRPTIERVHVGFMGCHGAINGLRVANGLAQTKGTRTLVCAVELCSLHYRFTWDPVRFIGNALFADGAAALVCDGGDAGRLSLRATGSCLIPDSTDAITWRIGDYGFEMTLSARVPELILMHLRPWLVEWLATEGVRLEDVRGWAVHPGGPRIVRAVEEALSLDAEQTRTSRDVLADHGNMSSPTVLFILDRLRRSGMGGPCVALGFGPGLVAEAALFDLTAPS